MSAMMKHTEKIKKKKRVSVPLLILCTIIVFAALYPIYFIIIASVSNPNAVSSGAVIFIPKGVSFFGYEQILKDTRIWTGYRNTIIYSFAGTALNLFVTMPAAYAMAQKGMAGKKFFMIFFTITMFFGGGLIPTYLLYKDIGLINNPLVFIIPGALNVYNMIIARTFFQSNIPKSLYEAAEMDGCTHFRFFLGIALPLSKAMIAVIALYYFVGHWNDFMTGLIFVQDADKQPLQLVLRDILIANNAFAGGTGAIGGGYAQQFADQIKYGVIIVSTLPVLVVYPFIQKYFEKGVMIGSIKE